MFSNPLIQNLTIHSDWLGFFDEETRLMLINISEQLSPLIEKKSINPDANRILFFLEQPLQSAQVVILGQDPYPQEGAATGRAFEVGTLKSWHQPFRNLSLQNIIRSVVQAYYDKTLTFNQIRNSIQNGSLPLRDPAELFRYWESQGVLLLNTSLSCERDKPGSHTKMWEPFTKKLFRYINRVNPNLYWFIWGKHAKQAVEGIDLAHQLFSYHPSRCQKRENDFLFGKHNCFRRTRHLVEWI